MLEEIEGNVLKLFKYREESKQVEKEIENLKNKIHSINESNASSKSLNITSD